MPEPASGDDKRLIEIADGDTRWQFDADFLRSNWKCIWGEGCKGILDHPAEELGQGCCSVGAELVEDEAPSIAMLAGFLGPEIFQFHQEAVDGGVFSDGTMTNTRIVDDACIFLNRPGFVGGEGCALHLAAIRDSDSPLDWKPSVCWQLPIRVDWKQEDNGTETAKLRAWSRADWGDDGETMAWCCTEEPEAYVGSAPVIESLAEELKEVVGTKVYLRLRSHLNES